MRKKGIKFQITVITMAMICLALFAMGATAVFFFNDMGSARALEHERTLHESFDRLVKQQVESAISVLENFNAKANAGEMTQDEAKTVAADVIRQMSYGADGYFWIDNSAGDNIVLLGNETEGTNRYNAVDLHNNSYVKDFIANGKAGDGGFTDYYFTKAGGTEPLPKRAYTKYFSAFDWVVGTGNYTDDIAAIVAVTAGEINSATFSSILIMLGIAAALIIVLVLLAYRFSKTIADPVNRLVNVMGYISDGDFNVEQMMLPQDKTGLFSTLVTGFYSVVNTIKQMTGDLSRINSEINAEGDIEYRVDAGKYNGAYKEMMESLNAFLNTFINDINDMFKSLTEIGGGNFDAEIKQLPGKKAMLADKIKLVAQSLNDVQTEVVTVAKLASGGKLDAQTNASAFRGDWSHLMNDLNGLLNTLAQKAFWYEALLDSIPFPISVTDTGMKWTFINKPTEDILGKKRQEVMGQPCSNWGAGICNTPNCGINCAKRGLNQTAFDQGGFNFQVDTAVLKDVNGKDMGYVEVVQDITKLESAILSQRKLMDEIKIVSEQLSSGTKQISEHSQDLAQGAMQQASSIEELNASVDMIDGKIQATARSAANANTLSSTAKQNAVNGNVEMQLLLSAMEKIKEASNNIGGIIKTITDISFQTNLLALNASVEAARAGEHGRGFSVVADEVRTLAGNSQKAASETNVLISESIKQVEEGTRIAQNTAKSLSMIVTDFDGVTKIINEIADASLEQAETIQQISSGIAQISEITQSNSAASQETASASEELASQSDVLVGLFTGK